MTPTTVSGGPGAATDTGSGAPEAPAPARYLLRPYGDTTGDAMVQVSFTLPLPAGGRAEGAALQLANKMGLDPATVVHSKGMGPHFTFFIVYGRVNHLVDPGLVEAAEPEWELLTSAQVNLAIRTGLRRKLVVLGATIGTDAHTVGIDAILNIKGFAGEKGLEYYREMRVVNMGSQVGVDDLVDLARAEQADAVLVSQVVTQRNAHIHNTKQLAAAFHAAFDAAALHPGSDTLHSAPDGPNRPLLVVGGPRFDTVRADDLGVDAIFGKGTTPRQVASFLVHRLLPGWVPDDSDGLDDTDGVDDTDDATTGEEQP